MTVSEVLNFDAQKRTIDQMRKAARLKNKAVRRAQANLRLQKVRQQLFQAQQAVTAATRD